MDSAGIAETTSGLSNRAAISMSPIPQESEGCVAPDVRHLLHKALQDFLHLPPLWVESPSNGVRISSRRSLVSFFLGRYRRPDMHEILEDLRTQIISIVLSTFWYFYLCAPSYTNRDNDAVGVQQKLLHQPAPDAHLDAGISTTERF